MNSNTKILIVEDNFVEANHIRLMPKNAGYTVLGIARSVDDAKEKDFVDHKYKNGATCFKVSPF